MRSPHSTKGFSLLEMMMVVAISSILMAIAILCVWNMIFNNRLTAYTNQFISSLNYARTEAIRRGITVSVCPSANGTACSGNNDWSPGWIVFVDNDASGAVNGGEAVLQYIQNTEPNFTLELADDNFLQYNPMGSLNLTESEINNHWFERLLGLLPINNAHASSPSTITKEENKANFVMCHDNESGKSGRTITIAPNGKITVTPVNCSSNYYINNKFGSWSAITSEE